MEDYAADTEVTLTATANAGHELSSWGGACSGTGSCVVTMAQARSVTAAFVATPTGTYPLTVTVTGNGTVTSNPTGINCLNDCTEDYDHNTIVTLTAAPDNGHAVQSWSGGGM